LLAITVDCVEFAFKNDDSEKEESDEESESDDEEEGPELEAAMLKHSGCVNRIRVYVI
jgi:hypothetical protein